jgi:2-amino-4-hydroxy-6-hydroxymethyldihydropteridine diphosphokinase
MIGLAFGGNLPDSAQCITEAMAEFSQVISGVKTSKLWQTKALGPGSSDYHNAVLVGEQSALTAYGLWRFCIKKELQYGRDRTKEEPWGDRVLDIDVLFYHDTVMATEDLVLPHPQMHRRSFVMGPLKEVLPEWQHFVLKASSTE